MYVRRAQLVALKLHLILWLWPLDDSEMNYLARAKAWLRLEVKKWFLGGLKLELSEAVGREERG
jgi:hypothetical protein